MKPPMGVVPLFYCYTARQLAAQCTVIGPVCVCVCGGRVGGVCYHDNSKLRASIFTKCSNNNNNNSRISIPPSVVTSEAVAEPVRSRKSAIVG